jgi:transcriptional regulator with PAS, ATPase and Fis domain
MEIIGMPSRNIQHTSRVSFWAVHEHTSSGLIGESPAMEKVRRMIAKVAAKTHPVLILGESGTGKELVARAIHAAGGDEKPFVAVDCAALSPTLIESELFGHVAGSFTGATRSKTGLIEAAQGGTLFLDEIGELPVEMQSKLLRTLQEKEVRPIGELRSRRVDVRVIAATNRDVRDEMERGRFRPDLYFRLAVVTIKVPPLRERQDDIPLLAAEFARRNAPAGYDSRITNEAMAALMTYDWPGNVRELQNAIERAVALNTNGPIRLQDLPTSVQSPARISSASPNGTMESAEKRAIVHALEKSQGNKLAAARMLGIGKTTLYRKIKEYSIPEIGKSAAVRSGD